MYISSALFSCPPKVSSLEPSILNVYTESQDRSAFDFLPGPLDPDTSLLEKVVLNPTILLLDIETQAFRIICYLKLFYVEVE